MKNMLRATARALKWLLISALLVEAACFFIITLSNWILYGMPREGDPVHYDPYALYLNRKGVKPTPGCPAPPEIRKPVRRIWMFGGSTMRGDNREGIPSLPSFLAAMLNKAGRAVHYECWNLGETSFNSLLEANYLQKRLIEGKHPPDVILFYDGANDAVYLSQYRVPYGHHGYRRFQSLVESYHGSLFGLLKPLNAALYSSFSRELYHKIMQTLVPLEENSSLVRDFVRLTEQRYDAVHRTARCAGAEFVLVLQPTWWVETAAPTRSVSKQEEAMALKEKAFPAMRENTATVYRALSRRLASKPYFVDFSQILLPRTQPVYRDDGVHLNGAGRRMVAAGIREILEQRGHLAPGPVPPGLAKRAPGSRPRREAP